MPLPPNWADDLALAHQFADAADQLTMARFRAVDLRVDTKVDETPVSDADRSVETAIRQLLASCRPADGVIGEEYGAEADDASRQWIIDPIDGTRNYLRGVPVWATLLALRVECEVVVGVVSAPALGRRWWAARGGGAFTGPSPTVTGPSSAAGRRCLVSAVDELGAAFLSYSSRGGWAASGRTSGFDALTAAVSRSRAFGDFWSHCLVAEGAVDLSAEPEVSLWDLAALQVLVEEAGGRFSDLSGAPRPDGGSVVCSNGLLHERALRLLSR